MSNKLKYHCFIAHSSRDNDDAIKLYNILDSYGVRVFLDSKSLELCDYWDNVLPTAQSESLITLLLISSNSHDSYYQSEEIARAINLARNNDRKILPVFLEQCEAPYGLNRVQGFYISDNLTFNDLALKIVKLINRLYSDNSSNIVEIDQPSINNKIDHKNHYENELDSIEVLKLKLEEIQKFALYNNVEACLIFCDIDGLTQINKKYEETIGDLVIENINNILYKTVDNEMTVMKIGVDEFVVFGLNINLDYGFEIAKAICKNISSCNWNELAYDLRVTVSIGVAVLKKSQSRKRSFGGNLKYGETVNDWIIRAIYGSQAAKKKGGNLVQKGPFVLPNNIRKDKIAYYLSD